MPSPFPGMNPYLENEDSWHTFHNGFCAECLRSLAPQVEPTYIVQSDENVYIHEMSADECLLVGRPDAFLSHETSGASTALAPPARISAPAYARIPAAIDAVREPILMIRDGKSREVVTVVEILSPTKKRPGPDRGQYLAKRRRYLTVSFNLVEIDLLRGWERTPLEGLPECDYRVSVSRVQERPQVAVWPLRLRDVLPVVPIPLKAGEQDVALDLQALLNRVYDDLRFRNYIYRNTPQPPLAPADAAWAETLLTAAAAP